MAIKDKELYKGKVIKQVKGIVDVFDKFFKKESFDTIVEIGSGNGIFSTYIAKKANEKNASFTTFDIKLVSKQAKKELSDLGANIITGNITKNTYVEELIKAKGRCLILNDGGLKVPEFHRFAKIMKKYDIMMTHDYYKGREEKSAGTVVISEVEDCIKDDKLKVIYEKIFEKHLWLCVTKENYK